MTTSRKVGLALSGAHFAVFILFVAYIDFFGRDAQLRLLWTLWLPIDFPISLLVIQGFEVIPSSTVRAYLPYLVHGVLGTLWWLVLPTIVSVAFRKLFGRARSGDEQLREDRK